MKISINADILRQVLQTVKPAIPSKTPIPVLNGIMFFTDVNELVVTTTDLNIGIRCKAQCTVHKEGITVLPKDIISLVDKLDKESVVAIETGENNVSTIKYGNSQVDLHGFDSDDFPELPKVEGEEYTLNIEPTKVTFACANEEHRPIFTGTLLDMDNGYIVATDTHRMAVSKIEQGSGQVVIPVQFMRMINPGTKLVISETQTKAIDGDVEYYSRNLKGNFPNWQMAIPKEFSTEIKVNTSQFKQAIQRTQTLADKVITLSIDGGLQIKAQSEKGKINEVVDCNVNGQALDVSFNSKYLFEGLKQVDDEEVTLKLSGKNTPAIMQGESEDWFYLIAPANVG